MSARFLCIGTHHKTGTVWMRRVLHEISRRQGIGIMQVNRAKRIADLPETGPQIVVNWSSLYPIEMLMHPEARFVHVIRDPRDVLISGMRYHQTAPLGTEKFLARQRPEWDGRNYKDHLRALATDQERLLVEMENKHHRTLLEMLAWPYGHPGAVELRFEELLADESCILFRAALSRCDIGGLDIDDAVTSFWNHSLFGGLKKQEDRPRRVENHMTSPRPAKSKWQSELPRSVARIYAERYGEALRVLGYAQDDSWVDLCPEDAALAEVQPT